GWVFELLTVKLGFDKLQGYRAIVGSYGGLASILIVAFAMLSPEVELERQVAAEKRRLLEERGEGCHDEVGDDNNAFHGDDLRFGGSATEHLAIDDDEGGGYGNGKAIPTRDGDGQVDGGPSASDLECQKKAHGLKLSMLFGMDSFATNIVTGTLLAYWFNRRYNLDEQYIGSILFAANLIGGNCSLLGAWLVSKIGLVNTMVFPHLPANVMLAMLPLMPTVNWAVSLLLLRYTIAQMDNAPRQAFITAIVNPEERTAVMGILNFVRTLGAAVGPAVTGVLAAKGNFDSAFYIAGAVKICYDFVLLAQFGGVQLKGEQRRGGS
ncbi:hypothetical protein HDU76_011173, partial [Blyttiomyces sp. JEL0837]